MSDLQTLKQDMEAKKQAAIEALKAYAEAGGELHPRDRAMLRREGIFIAPKS